MCIGPIIGPISADAAIPEIGLTSENYYAVGVKGDGSCWLRSAIHALIFHAFKDQKIIYHIVSAIGAASNK